MILEISSKLHYLNWRTFTLIYRAGKHIFLYDLILIYPILLDFIKNQKSVIAHKLLLQLLSYSLYKIKGFLLLLKLLPLTITIFFQLQLFMILGMISECIKVIAIVIIIEKNYYNYPIADLCQKLSYMTWNIPEFTDL